VTSTSAEHKGQRPLQSAGQQEEENTGSPAGPPPAAPSQGS